MPRRKEWFVLSFSTKLQFSKLHKIMVSKNILDNSERKYYQP
jgi:hypothetical protein